MASIVTNTTVNMPYLAYSELGLPCWPYKEVYSQTSRRTVVSRLEPEHRSKPTDLIRNTTSRALQYTEVAVPGFEVKYQQYRIWCSTQYVIVNRFNRNAISWSLPYPSLNPPPWQNDFRQKVADLRMNLAEYAAEYRETGDMFVNAARTFDGWWADFRNRNWRKLARRITPCTVAGAELASRYGIKPLVSDLDKALGLFAYGLNRPRRRRITSKSEDYVVVNTPGTYSGRLTARVDRKIRTVGYIEISPQLKDWNPGTPVEALWAGLPASFIFDFFIDVGHWLQQMDALRGISLIGLTTVDEKTIACQSNRTSAVGFSCESPASFFRKEYFRTNQIAAGVPLPTLRWSPSSTWRRVKAMTEIMMARRKCNSGRRR